MGDNESSAGDRLRQEDLWAARLFRLTRQALRSEGEGGAEVLYQALADLEKVDSRASHIVDLHYFVGATHKEIAEFIGISETTVKRELRVARAHLAIKVNYLRSGQSSADKNSGNLEEAAPPSLIEHAPSGIFVLSLGNPDLLVAINRDPGLLGTLGWREFEHLLAEILDRLGYEVELQRGTKDGGIDIFAIRRNDHFGPHRYLLQAKRSRNAIGVSPVRELLFLHQNHRMTRSCLATTSQFTKGAWKLAEEYPWQLELKDAEKLKEWIELAVRRV